jgi:exonuclease VII small subunit
MIMTRVIKTHRKMKVRNWRFNKTVLLGFFMIMAFGLLVLPVYHIPLVRVPVVNLPTSKWISKGVGAEYPAASFLSLVIGYVPDAVETVREERNELQAERNAFDAFIDEVNAIAAVEQSPTLDPHQSGIMLSTPKEAQLKEVRQAYEATVMAVAHYEEEYDDTITESLAEEFGPEIATQLIAGETFTPLVKEQLMEATRQSRLEREQFLSTLESEQEALHTAQTTLEEIDTELERIIGRLPSELSLNELIEGYNRFIDAEETCETVLEERQQQRIDGHAATAPRADIADLYPYLYRSLPVTYPVLADTTKLLDRLQRTQRRLAKELATRF